MAEVMAHIKFGDVADGSGKLNASRAAADYDEVERRMPAVFLHLTLGQFEGQEDTTANFGGVFDGLQAGSEEPTRFSRNRSGWNRWQSRGSHREDQCRMRGLRDGIARQLR